MKTTLICLLALGGIGILSSCVSVKKTEPTTRTTTTEKTTVSRPRVDTVETQTIRAY